MFTSRREFLTTSTAGLMSAIVVSQSPNERLGIALIGCGRQGRDLFGLGASEEEDLKNSFWGLRKQYNLECVALCDVWRVNLDRLADEYERETGRRPKTFTRYKELLALPEVYCVIIATPDFSHSPILTEAAKAKKHVYVEKPMAKRLAQAREAVDAVEANGIVCQVGTQQRSSGAHRAAAKVIQSGILGKIVKCQATFVRNEPSWRRKYNHIRREEVDWDQFLMDLPKEPFNPRRFGCWHLYRDFTNGIIGLLGVHPIDIAAWFTKDPLPLSAVGMETNCLWTKREHADIQECLFQFPKGHLMQFTGRLDNSNGGPPNVFYGSRGSFDTKTFTFSGIGGGRDKIVEEIKIELAHETSHMENWLACVRSGNRATRADVHAGYAHSLASIMGAKAAQSEQCIYYNKATRSIHTS